MSRRRLLLGITGGIAAFKAPALVRLFQNQGVDVKVVATENALKFVTPLTLEAITGFPVYSRMFEKKENNYQHIELSRWGEALVVAPATANTIAKFATGVADDLLSTLFVALKCPVAIAPAMNDRMITDYTVAKNLQTLLDGGASIIRPGSGYLACGTEGPGRMAEPEEIADRVMMLFSEISALSGKRILVTAGATREHIDPVRFITNRSSGKMGYAVAEAFIKYGASVTLVTGACNLYPPPGAEVVRITSAEDMFREVTARSGDQDVIIKAAAVADYTPGTASEHKLKKSGDALTLELKRTRDILAELGRAKPEAQILIGFSAETRDHLANSVEKLKKKNLDMIVLNDVGAADSGFEVDTNRVMFISRADGAPAAGGAAEKNFVKEIGGVSVAVDATGLMSKHAIAGALARRVIGMLEARQNT